MALTDMPEKQFKKMRASSIESIFNDDKWNHNMSTEPTLPENDTKY